MLYQIKEAIIGFPGNTLLERVSMEIRNTEKIAIVGRNGCGKTTLLKVIAGTHETDNLTSDEDYFIHKDGNVNIGYLEQMSFEDESVTVREELLLAYRELTICQEKMDKLAEALEHDASEQTLADYAKVAERFEAMGGYTYTSEMETMFLRFGFERSDLDRPLNTFSGGQKTKIAFAKLLLGQPDICLLDEPTNHLDLPTIEWLEGYLKNYRHAVVIVSHDRMFLDRISDVTYEIEYKHMKRYVGNYTAFLKQKQLDYEKQCKDYEEQQKEIERLTTFIEKWKNTPTKVSMTRSKKMQIEHMVKIPKPMRFDTRAIYNKFQPRKNSASEVLNVRNLKLGYTEELAEVSFDLRKGQRLAILGENGRGKSTLLKTLVGQVNTYRAGAESTASHAAQSGSEPLAVPASGAIPTAHESSQGLPVSEWIHFGKDVEWAYYDQELLNLNESKTVIEEFWDTYPDLVETEVRTILGNFLFTGDEVYQPIPQLSGGERVRLSLAKLMKRQANLLILDEPTNHLDMVGKDALESILKEYQGTILFVSHDRYFVNAVADCLLIFDHGSATYYPCNYETYLEKHSEGLTESKPAVKIYLRGNKAVDSDSTSPNNSFSSQADASSNGTVSSKEQRAEQKEQQRKERRRAQLEAEIAEQEKMVEKWKMKYTDQEIAADYEKLDEINQLIVAEEEKLNVLLLEWAGIVG